MVASATAVAISRLFFLKFILNGPLSSQRPRDSRAMSFHACTTEVNDAIVALRKTIELVTIGQITALEKMAHKNGVALHPQSPRGAKREQINAADIPRMPSAEIGSSSTVLPSGSLVDASGTVAGDSTLPSSEAPPVAAVSLGAFLSTGPATPCTLQQRPSAGLSANDSSFNLTALRGKSRSSSQITISRTPLSPKSPPPPPIPIEVHQENHRLLTSALDELVSAVEDQTMLMMRHLSPEEFAARIKAKGSQSLKKASRRLPAGAGPAKSRHSRQSKRDRRRERSNSQRASKHKRGVRQQGRAASQEALSISLNEDDDVFEETENGIVVNSKGNVAVRRSASAEKRAFKESKTKRPVKIMGHILDDVEVDGDTGEPIRREYPTNGKYSSSSSASYSDSDDDGSHNDSACSTSSTSRSSQSPSSKDEEPHTRRGSSLITGTRLAPNAGNYVPPARQKTEELTKLADVMFTSPFQDVHSVIERGGVEGQAALATAKIRAKRAVDGLLKESAEGDLGAARKAASECRKAQLETKRKERRAEKRAMDAIRLEDAAASSTGKRSQLSLKTTTETTRTSTDDMTPTPFAQRKAEAIQLSKLRRLMDNSANGGGGAKERSLHGGGTYTGQLHVHPTDKAALEALSVTFSCILQSCAHFLQASRARLYLPHHQTQTMKLVAACPDSSVVTLRGGQFIARNQGLPGAAANSGIAISIDSVTSDIRRSYLSSTFHGDTVESIFVMPIHNPNKTVNRGDGDDSPPNVIGVMEFINKSNGQRWSEFDENHAYHTATLLSHFIVTFGQGLLDLHQMPAFQLSQVFHAVVPYAPAPTYAEFSTLNPPRDSEIIAAAMQAASEEQVEVERRATLGEFYEQSTNRDQTASRHASTKRGLIAGGGAQSSTSPQQRRLSFDSSPVGGRKITHPHSSAVPASSGASITNGYNPFSSTPLQRGIRTMLFQPQGDVAASFHKPVLVARVTELAEIPFSASSAATASVEEDLFIPIPQGVFDTKDEEEVYKKRIRHTKKHASRIREIGAVRYVREMSAYLASLEDSSRTTMEDLVTARTKVNAKVEEILELSGKVKVLESNCQYLNERLVAAQRQHLQRSITNATTPGQPPFQQQQQPGGPSTGGVESRLPRTGSGGGAQQVAHGQSVSNNSMTTVNSRSTPNTLNMRNRNPSPMPTDAKTLRMFLQQANLAAEELKREALRLPAINKQTSQGNRIACDSVGVHGNGPLQLSPKEHRRVYEGAHVRNTLRGKKVLGGSQTPGFGGKYPEGRGGVSSPAPQQRSVSSML